jgi:hypothetical protein
MDQLAVFAAATCHSRADKLLTWINRRPSALFGQSPAIARHTVWPDGSPERPSMRKIAIVTVVAALLGANTAAQAGSLGRPCTSAPQSQWLPIEALQAKVEALGYKVQKAKLKNACGELYTIDKTGGRVELFVDPTNGQIVGQL